MACSRVSCGRSRRMDGRPARRCGLHDRDRRAGLHGAGAVDGGRRSCRVLGGRPSRWRRHAQRCRVRAGAVPPLGRVLHRSATVGPRGRGLDSVRAARRSVGRGRRAASPCRRGTRDRDDARGPGGDDAGHRGCVRHGVAGRSSGQRPRPAARAGCARDHALWLDRGRPQQPCGDPRAPHFRVGVRRRGVVGRDALPRAQARSARRCSGSARGQRACGGSRGVVALVAAAASPDVGAAAGRHRRHADSARRHRTALGRGVQHHHARCRAGGRHLTERRRRARSCRCRR